MIKKSAILLSAALALTAGATTVYAQGTVAHNPCSKIRWSGDFLAKYPLAAVVCADVVVKDGRNFARFDGVVTSASKDAVVVDFVNVRGDAVREIHVVPGPNQTVEVNGKAKPLGKLERGDRISVYLPEGSIGFVTDPGAHAVTTITTR